MKRLKSLLMTTFGEGYWKIRKRGVPWYHGSQILRWPDSILSYLHHHHDHWSDLMSSTQDDLLYHDNHDSWSDAPTFILISTASCLGRSTSQAHSRLGSPQTGTSAIPGDCFWLESYSNSKIFRVVMDLYFFWLESHSNSKIFRVVWWTCCNWSVSPVWKKQRSWQEIQLYRWSFCQRLSRTE